MVTLLKVHGIKYWAAHRLREKIVDISRKRVKSSGCVLPRKIVCVSRATRSIVCFLL